jgi:hypothetical protein
VRNIARRFGDPCNSEWDACDCKGISCLSLNCPRWWAIFFQRYTESDIIAMVQRHDRAARGR